MEFRKIQDTIKTLLANPQAVEAMLSRFAGPDGLNPGQFVARRLGHMPTYQKRYREQGVGVTRASHEDGKERRQMRAASIRINRAKDRAKRKRNQRRKARARA
jgi:hypothetical protein